MCSLVCASEHNVKQSDVFPQVEETFSPKCASNVGQLLQTALTSGAGARARQIISPRCARVAGDNVED